MEKTNKNADVRARVEQLSGSDPFIQALAATVPGWLRAGNVWCFKYMMQNLGGTAPLLEIGSFAGLSTIALLYFKRKFGVTNALITCDPWQGHDGSSDLSLTEHTQLTRQALGEFVRSSFVRNVAFFSPDELPASFQMTSDDFFRAWTQGETHTDVFGRAHTLGGRFTVCYIDGSHSYAFVKRDFENVDALLAPGGFVLLDDSEANGTGGPSRVADEVVARGGYELVHRAPNALFRKSV